MLRWSFRVCVLLSLIAGEFRLACAQDWHNVSTPTGTDLYLTPYYLNPDVGFTFVAGISEVQSGFPVVSGDLPNMARTTDAGISWTMIPLFDSLGLSVTQLCFVSLAHGYASTVSVFPPSASGPIGIYETTDQGNTWKKISRASGWFSGVYSCDGEHVFATELEQVGGNGTPNYRGSQLIYSSNDGITWDSLSQVGPLHFGSNRGWGFQWIYGNRDSLVATIYLDSANNSHLVYSSDLGTTWNWSLLDPGYDWDMVALHLVPHSCRIIREFLDNPDVNGDTYSFAEADPPYTIWNLPLQHLETGAWVAGNECAMYVSYAGKDFSLGPIQRSTDDGASWALVGFTHTDGSTPNMDEIDDRDWQNISVVGYGAVIYSVGTNAQGMWETTDGGDGALSASALAPRITFEHAPFFSSDDTLYSSLCQSASVPIAFQNLSCAITKLTSYSVNGLSSTEYSSTTTNHHDCLSLPDTIYLTISPTSSGIRTVTVSAQFTDDEYKTLDTSLSFILDVRPGSTIPIGIFFNPPTITASPGDTISIPIYVSGSSDLGAASLDLPFRIDSNFLQPIGFQTLIPGLALVSTSFKNDTEKVYLHSDGLSLNGDTLVGILRCMAYISDSLSTSVSLTKASLGAETAPCIALALTSEASRRIRRANWCKLLLPDQYLQEFRIKS